MMAIHVIRYEAHVSTDLVELGEVVNDNRNWQCDDQHAANAANAAHNFPQNRLWVDITVPHRRHSNACPPESFGNASECGYGL